jgi:hypothetical protein
MNQEVLNRFKLEFSKACFDAGIEKKTAYTLTEACTILSFMGYSATQSLLNAWQINGILEPVDDFLWTEQHVIGAAIGCELRRIWLPYPNPIHDHKKSAIRLEREKTPHDQVLAVYDQVSRYDTLWVLSMMAAADDRREREECFELLLGRLDLQTGEFRSPREQWRGV